MSPTKDTKIPFLRGKEMPAFASVKAEIQLPAGVEGQQFPLHPCHVQVTRATLGAPRLRTIHPTAFKVLNPNSEVLNPRASSCSDHLNPSTDTFVLRSTRVCSQFMQRGLNSPKDTLQGHAVVGGGAAQTTEMRRIKTFCLSSRKQREKTLINSAASC